MDDNIKFLKQKDKQDDTNFTSNPISGSHSKLSKAKNLKEQQVYFKLMNQRLAIL